MPGYFRMRRDLTVPIKPSPFPANVVLVNFDRSVAVTCRDLMDRAYGEVGYAPVRFDGWYTALIGDSEYDPALIWVAMAEGRVVGFCQCWSVPFVKDLVVDKVRRRHGLGAALLTLAMATFSERGALRLELKTDIENETAQSLYRRLGFVIVERVGG